MNNKITIVTENIDFYKQIIQLFLPDISKNTFEQILPGHSLDTAQLIITDGSDNSVFEENVPVFLIAHKLPKHVTTSLLIRFYQIGTFLPDSLVQDVFEWLNLLNTMNEMASETEIAEKRYLQSKRKLDDYEKCLSDAKTLQKEVMMQKSIEDFEIASHYQSTAKVSGDILLVKEVNNRLFIIIGDVTDHGYAAGLYGTSLFASAQSYLSLASSYELTLEGLVRYMQYASSFYQPEGYGILRQKTSATMLFCEIDKKNNEIHFINCGHGNEPPVIIRKNNDAFLLSFDANKSETLPAIGDFSSIPPEKYINLPFSKGDSLVLYTDGITEIFKDAQSKDISNEYSAERLLSSVCHEIQKKDWSVKSILDGIKKDAESYAISPDLETSKYDINDDITMIAIKWRD